MGYVSVELARKRLLAHARARAVLCRVLRTLRRSGLAGLFGSVFGRTLGLDVRGVEDAVTPEASFGQGLCVVLESVGRSLGSGVNNRQSTVLLHQLEFGCVPWRFTDPGATLP